MKDSILCSQVPQSSGVMSSETIGAHTRCRCPLVTSAGRSLRRRIRNRHRDRPGLTGATFRSSIESSPYALSGLFWVGWVQYTRSHQPPPVTPRRVDLDLNRLWRDRSDSTDPNCLYEWSCRDILGWSCRETLRSLRRDLFPERETRSLLRQSLSVFRICLRTGVLPRHRAESELRRPRSVYTI